MGLASRRMKRLTVLIALLVGGGALASCNVAKGLAGTSTRIVQSAGRSVGF
jgi:hypothetical protein